MAGLDVMSEPRHFVSAKASCQSMASEKTRVYLFLL